VQREDAEKVILQLRHELHLALANKDHNHSAAQNGAPIPPASSTKIVRELNESLRSLQSLLRESTNGEQ
jgi:hypothetical protein